MKLKELVMKKMLKEDFTMPRKELTKLTGRQASGMVGKSVSQIYQLTTDRLEEMSEVEFQNFEEWVKKERPRFRALGHVEKMVAAYLMPLEETTYRKLMESVKQNRAEKARDSLDVGLAPGGASPSEPTRS